MVTISVSRAPSTLPQSTLTSTSSGNASADAGAAVVIAHAIAHPTTARATFSLASSIHDVEFARRHCSSRSTSPRRRVRARRRRRPRSHRRRHPRVRHRPRRRPARASREHGRPSIVVRDRDRVVDASSPRATTGRPTSSRRRSRSERIHARRPTNTYVSLPLPNVRSFSLSFTTPHPLATRREDEQKNEKNEKKNENRRHRRNKTKRMKTLGVDDDPSRAWREIARSARARDGGRAKGGETPGERGGDEQGPVRTRARTVREVHECPGGYLKRANETRERRVDDGARRVARHPENDATLMNCWTCGCSSDAHEIDECADWRERGNDVADRR